MDSNIKGKLLIIVALVLITVPFLLSIMTNPVQSYTDFFIRGITTPLSSIYSWSSSVFGNNVGGSIWRFLPLSLFYTLSTDILKLSSGISQLIFCSLLFSIAYFSYIRMAPILLDLLKPNSAAVRISGLFYIFNPYTLTQFTNSFLLVIPYMLLPLQILLVLRLFETKKYIKYSLLLALVNASCFGINLIFDVISLLILVVVAYAELRKRYDFSLRNIAIYLSLTYAVTLLLCSFWIVPQIYGSLTDTATSNYVLQSEQFYNSDSSLVHVLRGLGEWSFFSSQNNIPYNNFATAYKSNPLVIASGYFVLLISLLPLLFYKRGSRERVIPVLLVTILFIIFIIIVGTYPEAPFAGIISFAFKHVPFAMAFRNTYKFASVEMLLIGLLLTITLSNINRRWKYKNRLPLTIGGGVFILLICVGAFPFFANKLYSKNIQIQKVPDYWHSTTSFINARPNANLNSVFMLPDQYFEAFRWNGMLKTFSRNLEDTLFKPSVVHNTCKGCGQYLTSNFLSYTYNNLSSSGIIKLLGITGNSLIVQRNDFDYKYYPTETPHQISTILNANSNVKKSRTFGKLDIYQINKQIVNPLFYSPKRLIATDAIDSFATIANQNDRLTDLVLSNTLASADHYTGKNSNYYQPVFSSSHTSAAMAQASSIVTTPRKDTYQLKKTSITNNYRMTYSSPGGTYTLKLEKVVNSIKVNGRNIDISAKTPINIPLGNYGNASIVVQIQKHSYLLQPDQAYKELADIAFNPADTNLQIYSTSELGPNLVSNSSLESGLWQKNVTDCASTSGKPDINMKQVTGGASEGTHSLLLSSKQDSACTFTPPLTNFKPGSYFFSFDAKRNKGSAPAYCVWNGKQCVAFSKVNAGKQWTPYSQAVYLDSSASNFYLYLYAQKANYTQSQDQYDNVRIYRLNNPLKALSYSLPTDNAVSTHLSLGAGRQTFQTGLTLSNDNLIDNGSFRDGPWQSKVQDCTNQTGKSVIKMSVVQDREVGNALDLYTDGTDSACTSSAFIRNYEKGSSYLLNFKYQVLQGKQAKLCVWNGKTCIVNKTITSQDHNWHSASQLVVPGTGYQPLSIYLYAPTGDGSEVRYTGLDMRQIENSFVNSYLLTNNNLHEVPSATIEFKENNPTRYELSVTTKQPSLMVFSQSYHPDWKAYVVKDTPKTIFQQLKWSLGMWQRYRIPDTQHIVANGYANGWWIDPGNIPASFQASPAKYYMLIDYSPQSLVNIGLVVSGVTLVGCIGYLVRGYLPKREHFKGWRYAGRR